KRRLVVQCGPARGFLQRTDHASGSGTKAWNCVQHKAQQHSASRFLRATAGDAIQREPDRCQRWLRQSCLESIAWMLRIDIYSVEPGMAQRVSRGSRTNRWKVSCLFRRVRLEIHSQCV